MAQVFWEQIRDQLPDIGEFLTGSLNVSGSFHTSGSLSIDLDGVEDVFKISVAGQDKLKVNSEGTLQLSSQAVTPSAVAGGVFYSSSNDYYLGFG